VNTPASITLPAPAKINLHLHIRSVLEGGMHELDTSFAFTEAHDLLHFRPADTIEVSCSEIHLGGEHNLIHRVLTALQQQQRVNQGLSVHIDKRLPEQAGLGGGSSDAATALMYANKVWNCNLSAAQLIDFAAPFGADIPCFLYGRASLASGIGERLMDYPEPLPDQTLLLAWPGSGLSTAAVFKYFDEHMPDPLVSAPETRQPTAALTGSGGLDTMRRDSVIIGHNDLEASACILNPQVADLLHFLRSHAERAWMSGSGSACVALLPEKQQADDLADLLLTKGLAAWTHSGRLVERHPVQIGA